MTGPVLDSMLLASADPDRLHAWYAATLEPADDAKVDEYRILRFGGFHLMIDRRDDLGPSNREPTRTIVNFDVPDIHAIVGRMDEHGTAWHAPVEDRDGSHFATAVDPDGNYVQLVQLSDEHRAAMEAMEG